MGHLLGKVWISLDEFVDHFLGADTGPGLSGAVGYGIKVQRCTLIGFPVSTLAIGLLPILQGGSDDGSLALRQVSAVSVHRSDEEVLNETETFGPQWPVATTAQRQAAYRSRRNEGEGDRRINTHTANRKHRRN